MKTVVLFILIIIQSAAVCGQRSFYDHIQTGTLGAGYTDTIMYDKQFRYEEFGYSGMKPYFIRVWHPVRQQRGDTSLLWKDMIYVNAKPDLDSVQAELVQKQKAIITRDFIAENIATGEPNEGGDAAFDSIYQAFGRTRTRSIQKKIMARSKYPVIIYHHGAQSSPLENFAMAEYFASRGYIFIAASFHWPFANTTFGLRPYQKIVKNEDEKSLGAILEFAQSISSNRHIFFIGHSWGAQMGLRTFDQEKVIKGMVSLETTIEFKNDDAKIRELWPEVYQKIVTDKAYYPFPLLFCAATGKKEAFPFFAQVKAPRIMYATVKEDFEHDAYVAFFYLRYFSDSKIQEAEEKIWKDRLRLYVKHLELAAQFFHTIITGKKETGEPVRQITE